MSYKISKNFLQNDVKLKKMIIGSSFHVYSGSGGTFGADTFPLLPTGKYFVRNKITYTTNAMYTLYDLSGTWAIATKTNITSSFSRENEETASYAINATFEPDYIDSAGTIKIYSSQTENVFPETPTVTISLTRTSPYIFTGKTSCFITKTYFKVVIDDGYTENTVFSAIEKYNIGFDITAESDGVGIGTEAVSGKLSVGWPLDLPEPLAITEGGTGAETAAEAFNNWNLDGKTDAEHANTDSGTSGYPFVSGRGVLHDISAYALYRTLPGTYLVASDATGSLQPGNLGNLLHGYNASNRIIDLLMYDNGVSYISQGAEDASVKTTNFYWRYITMAPDVLYTGDSNGVITLAYDASNYARFRIFFRSSQYSAKASIDVYGPNGSHASMFCCTPVTGSNVLVICGSVVYIAGTTITPRDTGHATRYIDSSIGGWGTNNNEIYIYRVEGWRI